MVSMCSYEYIMMNVMLKGKRATRVKWVHNAADDMLPYVIREYGDVIYKDGYTHIKYLPTEEDIAAMDWIFI